MNKLQVVFNTIDKVMEDYLSYYKGSKSDVEYYYYHDADGIKKLCLRIKGTVMMDTFKTYKVNTKGQFVA